MKRLLLCLVLTFSTIPAYGIEPKTTEPPLAPPAIGLMVPGRVAQAPPLASTITVQAGRFIPVITTDGNPSYIPPSEAYRVYKIAPGSFFTGVKYDAPDGAENEPYSWPDVKQNVYILWTRPIPGKYSVQAVKNGPADVGPIPNGGPISIEIIGGKPIPPVPPIPPPVPPVPPGPVTGLRVVLVYESSANMSREQLNTLYSTKISDYLDKHTAATDGGVGWKRWDKDIDTSKSGPTWQKLWTATKPKLGTLPQFVIVTDQTGEILPFPATEADGLALLQKYGGP